jgi:indole-3-glycerol phosphate synthase
MSRLAEIVAHKKQEIAPWVKQTHVWHQRAASLAPLRGFQRTLTAGKTFGLIGEVKKASPSAGIIATDFDPLRTAMIYHSAGANCISVLTDERFFQGHLDYLALIRRKVPLPLLRKDFTIHEVQIYQAALAGADAVLLIASVLSNDELERFQKVAAEISIDCLVEVHDEVQLARVLDNTEADFIAINNRDLATFETDLKVTERLAPKVPAGCTIVSESGIKTTDDVRRVVRAGAHAALVGESLMRAADPGALLESFMQAASDAR